MKRRNDLIIQTYKNELILENGELDIYDIKSEILIEYSFTPGQKETPPTRNKYGSILSYQDVGDPEEPPELELLSCEIDLNKLRNDIVKHIMLLNYSNFELFAYVDDIFVFKIDCVYNDQQLYFLEEDSDIVNTVLNSQEIEKFLFNLIINEF
ncbi:MAG TPA: hypothetical protein VJ895_02145 [Candidatus Nanoarchaeia archaeon]|nr:hypothetical protein [Candidatus Nanoarchaeia archaeon]